MIRLRAIILTLLSVAGLGFTATPAQADFMVNYSVGSFFQDHLANDGTVGTSFDKLTLSTFSGSVTLAEDVPTVAEINPYLFEVGLSSSRTPYTTFSDAVRSMTVNGVPGTLHQPFSVISLLLSIGDPLDMTLGSKVTFDVVLDSDSTGKVDVTPLPVHTQTTSTATGHVNATFLLHNVEVNPVPEPGSFTLLAVGAVCLFGYNRSRRSRLA